MDSGPPSEIYFAENLSSYVLTGAEQAEFNYQKAGATDQFTRYKGKDGVKLSNFVRRAAFALRFGSLDPLISGQINSNTKLLMERDIRARVTKLAPFLAVRRRPVPGRARRPDRVDHGRLHDVRHVPVRPVARRRGLADVVVQLRAQLGEGHRRRLPGHGHLLRVRQEGPDHPGVRGRRSPTSSPTARGCPQAIRDHLRYPEDLFKSQADDVRPLPRDRAEALLRRQRQVAGVARPGLGSGVARPALRGDRIAADGSSASSSNQPQAASSTGARIDPYYLNIRLPGRDRGALHRTRAVRAGVVGQQPDAPRVVPHRELRSRAVREDEPFTMPQGQTVLGPGAGEQPDHPHRDDLHRDHAAQPAGLAGHPGEHAADPVGNSIIYVRPFYAQGAARARTRCSSSSSCSRRTTARSAARTCRTRSTRCSPQSRERVQRRRRRRNDRHQRHHDDHDHDDAGHGHHRTRHDRADDHHGPAGRPAARRSCSTRRRQGPRPRPDRARGRRPR